MFSRSALGAILKTRPMASRFLSSSSPLRTPLIVSPKQAQELATQGNVAFLDASWFMPNSPRDPNAEYAQKHIPGAYRLDLDAVASDHPLGLKHMMPPPRLFADACESMGITPESHVVLYDSLGIFSSPRALFMFKSFGHTKASVLDGGLPRWEDEGGQIESGDPSTPHLAKYPTPQLEEGVVKDYEHMVARSQSSDPAAEVVLDARPLARFKGTAPEPRPGLSSGHMPGATSLTFDLFLQSNGKYTMFKPLPEIRAALDNAVGSDVAQLIIDGKRAVTTTCGSGMTAGILWLGLKLLGTDKIGLYDESWTGYALRKESKIETST